MRRFKQQYGFTLVELMIYSVVASIAITLAFHIWSNAAISGNDTRRRFAMSRDMQEMLFFVEDDLSRLGAKAANKPDSAEFAVSGIIWNEAHIVPDIFIDTNSLTHDYSSFKLVDGDSLDALHFKALVYDSLGAVIGLDSVSYFVDGSQQLIRTMSRWTFDENGIRTVVTSDSAITVASNVHAFNIHAGVYSGGAVGDTLFRPNDVLFLLGSDGFQYVGVTTSPTERTIHFNFDSTLFKKHNMFSFRDSVTGFDRLNDSMVVGNSYRLDFEMRTSPNMALHFNTPVPGSTMSADTVAMLLVNPITGALLPGIDTLYLYPTTQDTAQQLSFELSPSASASAINLHLRIRFAFTSKELISGEMLGNRIEFSKITLHRLNSGQYKQVSNPTVEEKERSKSFDIEMTVRRSDAQQKHGRAYLEQSFRKIVKIPNNGPIR